MNLADPMTPSAGEIATPRELRRMALINRRDLLRATGGPQGRFRTLARTAPRVGQNRDMDVRNAALDDADAVVELAQAAYRGESSRQGWTTEADLLDGGRTDAPMVRELIASEGSVILVIDDYSAAPATATAEPAAGPATATTEPRPLLACCHLERRPDCAYLGLFAVRPGMQGRGVGTALLAAAEALAHDWGAARLELTVLNHRPELLAWYERLGFVTTGATVPFPYGDERFGVPRRPDLVLQAMSKPLDGAGRSRAPRDAG